MKKLFCILLSAFLLTSIFTGCTQTDATTSVEVTEAVAGPITAASESGNLSGYAVPDRFTGNWTGLENTFLVNADAEILIPDTDRMVTASVKPKTFSQAEADAMMEVFLKGNTLYEEPVATKTYLQNELAHYEAILRGEIPYDHDGTIDHVPGIIERLKKGIEAAPNDGERIEANPIFHKNELPEGAVHYGIDNNEQVIRGYAIVDGKNIHCSIRTCDDPTAMISGVYATFWEEGYGAFNGWALCSNRAITSTEIGNEEPVEPGFSVDQAQALADNLLAKLGMNSFSMDSATPVTFGGDECDTSYYKATHAPDGEMGYDLIYVRNVAGLPLTWTKENGSGLEENSPNIGYWGDELIRILVTEDRVVWFEWTSPYTEPVILENNVTLAPFPDIQEVFAKMIFVKNHEHLEANRINGFDVIQTVNVDKVHLTMMRTRPKDSVSEGTLIPVWDFWAETSARPGENAPEGIVYNGRYYEVVLTINAITGTVIDREIGY